MAQNISIIIVEKSGSLKSHTMKEYKEEDLYKKCGFKKADGFEKHTEWGLKIEGKKYIVALYGKVDGKANTENKYDFPPPVDTMLFFGSCVLVASVKNNDDTWCIVPLSLEHWNKMYEKLFGGFEDLVATCAEDEEEEDELENIPASKKTKQGYLKDGFVVDSDSSDEKDESYDSEEEDEDEDEQDNGEADEQDEALELEDIGSELSEEEYESSSDEEDSK
jgi:hypothetical protein